MTLLKLDFKKIKKFEIINPVIGCSQSTLKVCRCCFQALEVRSTLVIITIIIENLQSKNNDGNDPGVHKLTSLELICRQLAQADNAPIALIYFVVVSVEVTHKSLISLHLVPLAGNLLVRAFCTRNCRGNVLWRSMASGNADFLIICLL